MKRHYIDHYHLIIRKILITNPSVDNRSLRIPSYRHRSSSSSSASSSRPRSRRRQGCRSPRQKHDRLFPFPRDQLPVGVIHGRGATQPKCTWRRFEFRRGFAFPPLTLARRRENAILGGRREAGVSKTALLRRC